MEQIGIENGSDIQISIQDGKIILAPVKDRAKLLDALLDKIDESTIHREINFGKPIGKELVFIKARHLQL